MKKIIVSRTWKVLVQEIVDRSAMCPVLPVIQHIKGHGIDLCNHLNTDEHYTQSNCVSSPWWEDEYTPVSWYTASWSGCKCAYEQGYLRISMSSYLKIRYSRATKMGNRNYSKEREFCSEPRWNSQAPWVSKVHSGLQSAVLASSQKDLSTFHLCVSQKSTIEFFTAK